MRKKPLDRIGKGPLKSDGVVNVQFLIRIIPLD